MLGFDGQLAPSCDWAGQGQELDSDALAPRCYTDSK